MPLSHAELPVKQSVTINRIINIITMHYFLVALSMAAIVVVLLSRTRAPLYGTAFSLIILGHQENKMLFIAAIPWV
jgi:hypothetical protein